MAPVVGSIVVVEVEVPVAVAAEGAGSLAFRNSEYWQQGLAFVQEWTTSC